MLTGAQLAKVLQEELTLPIKDFTFWTDSTTVLSWLRSESCHFKVFVGTRVAEIQDLTEGESWRYVASAYNPADDITRGKPLSELTVQSRWGQGPTFRQKTPDQWPEPSLTLPTPTNSEELRKAALCGLTVVPSGSSVPDASQFKDYRDLMEVTVKALPGVETASPTAEHYRAAENLILQRPQQDSFSADLQRLKEGKPVPSNSRLRTLSPLLDSFAQLIRVGGRLRHSPSLEAETIHPVVLDPKHPTTQLIIRAFDEQLHHSGTERVFTEMRRKYWILRGRKAIKHHQRQCTDCRKWRGKPEIPVMADLPSARLRLHKPAFYSTGVDCFGPYTVRVGRRNEKRWGVIFKCLTTRAVHLDLLSSMDTDAFLMALRRFVARRGKPYELLSDQGTNFRGGERELKEAFASLQPELQTQLAPQQIKFAFNPPSAPHFGGCWEREIRSLKRALEVTLGAQTVTEEVLMTVLIEVEEILNSKPLGYVSSDVADPDPITPNILLMGRLDASLPQVVYPQSELLSRRRWRHSQLLADHFWKHFIQFYLPGLQARQKWYSDTPNIEIGATVMIIDSQLPRALWCVGRVTQTLPGGDGKVRTVQVKVGDRSYTRPVARLIRLPALPE